MKALWRIAVWLCMLVFQITICHAQCLSDDSIRQEISIIKNDQSDNYLKIHKLTTLRISYLKCHQKTGAVYAEIMHRLGDYYAQTGNLELGIAYTVAAVNINEHTGIKKPFLCNSYYNLGIFYLQLNLIHQSNDCFNRCITTGRNFPEKYFITGMAHTQLAYAFFKAGDYQQAKEISSKGMFFSNAAKDTVEGGALWVQKAQAEIELGDFKSAQQSIIMALSMLKGKATIQLASAYSTYANFLNATGKHQASLVYYLKAFLLNKKLQNFNQCANDQNDLGNVYGKDLKQEANARKCFTLGLQLASKYKNSYQMVGFYENIGVSYWRQGDYKQALTFYQKGLNALPIKFKDTAVISNPTIGMLSQVSNDYYVSTLLADKAESLLASHKKKSDKNLLKAALQTFTLADRSVDMMRWKQYGELSKLLWRSQTRQMYENAIEVCYLLNDIEKAFYFFEKSRSVLLNDQLSYSSGTQFIPDEKLKKKLQAKMDSLNKQLISLNSDELVKRLKTEWLSVHQEWEDEQNQLKAKLSESTMLPDSSFWSVKKVQQQLLNNKQSLVEYFNNNAVVYALLITPVKAQIYKISYADYFHDSSEFLKYCSNAGLLNQHYDHYTNLARKLYQNLFEPLQIKTQRVIISPGDHFISFDALLDDPHSDDSFLVKKYSFSYVYSMRVLMNHRRSTTDQKIVFLGIAPENYASPTHLQSLTGSVASLKRIGARFKASLLLNGENAKRSQLLAKLPQSQIAQIYSHAAADSTTRDPLLYLADSVVLMSDIQKLKCRGTGMVVLSACNTGVGYMAVGEGLFSLARGFRLAGIPSTVTNLWQADNQATYELTESFYNYLRIGLPKDVSLRLAKLDYLKSDQSHLLPYYWGATIILGDSSAVITPLSQGSLNFIQLFIPSIMVVALLGCLYVLVFEQKKPVK
ncbi:CHAT domain-containing protein [Mucilaginibacter lappiensis]|uniref:CHAT domain-containing protein n=1 Tax=Mucilaginibacter lappiensis TaxID=354630 RepID=UPI003D21F435